MTDTSVMLRTKYEFLKRALDERSLRICAGADAQVLGHGGMTMVSEASGLSRTTIYAGMHAQPLSTTRTSGTHRVRAPGGGRKHLTDVDKKLMGDLDRLLDPATRGDPMSPLRWTCKSTPKLAKELQAMGHRASPSTVWRLLDERGYSLQSNRKTYEGGTHPDRHAQFEFIDASIQDFQQRGLPVISVDTKKKELVGQYRNGGREWHPKGVPVEVNVYDFLDPVKGKVSPCGVYEIGRHVGWVSVGISHDTSAFAVESIRRWWLRMGTHAYPTARELLITADGGGSNGYRVRLWKAGLKRLAGELNMTLHVRHLPPGTSTWNKIEHRMFCHITQNWRGRPLEDLLTIVSLIASTSTNKGLKIEAELDLNQYDDGKKIDEREMAKLGIIRSDSHGEWNYAFSP